MKSALRFAFAAGSASKSPPTSPTKKLGRLYCAAASAPITPCRSLSVSHLLDVQAIKVSGGTKELLRSVESKQLEIGKLRDHDAPGPSIRLAKYSIDVVMIDRASATVLGSNSGFPSTVAPGPSNISPALKVAISQSELDDLISGIDFNDNFNEISPPRSHLTSSNISKISKSSPDKVGAGRRFAAKSTSTARFPLPHSSQSQPSTFFLKKPSTLGSKSISLARADFSTSTMRQSKERFEPFADLIKPGEDERTLELISNHIDDTLGSSSFEILTPASKSRWRVATKENEAVKVVKAKARKVIEIDDDDLSEEIASVSKKRSPSTNAAPVFKPASSGWFTRPTPAPASSITTVLSATPKPKAIKSKRAAKVAKTLTPYELEKVRFKAAKLSTLSKLKPFAYETWSATSPELIFTSKESVAAAAIDAMLARGSKMFGFDLEWEPSMTRGKENKTALVQICDNDVILLVQVSKMSVFSPSIQKFLCDSSLYKCGVQVSGDGKKLYRDHAIRSEGLIELTAIARSFDAASWSGRTGLIGLQDQVGKYLERYLDKDGTVRMGKWSSSLAIEQQLYAANDVYSSLQVFNQLSSLSPTTIDLIRFATSISGTRTSISSPAARRLPPTQRQLEAFNHFAESTLTPDEVSKLMSEPPSARILPLSAVWNLLGALDRDPSLKMEDTRLLDLVSQVSGSTKTTMTNQFDELLSAAEARETSRLESHL